MSMPKDILCQLKALQAATRQPAGLDALTYSNPGDALEVRDSLRRLYVAE